ncbi:MAG: SDR family NAD(P)-dependent oxidoreductase [Candidatus Competibacteraceae bacterium]
MGGFLELGKRDLYQNSKLGLWAFRRSLSFFAVDLSRLMAERPRVIQNLLREIHDRIERGHFHPLPHRVLPLSRMREAFRHMAQAKHIGKVVISLHDQNIGVEREDPPAPRFDPAAVYLITGGVGGFGLVVARWLVANGARHLALSSRRGELAEDESRALKTLISQGAEVRVMRSDVTDEQDISHLIAAITATGRPLKGVFHAAMVSTTACCGNSTPKALPAGHGAQGRWLLEPPYPHTGSTA